MVVVAIAQGLAKAIGKRKGRERETKTRTGKGFGGGEWRGNVGTGVVEAVNAVGVCAATASVVHMKRGYRLSLYWGRQAAK